MHPDKSKSKLPEKPTIVTNGTFFFIWKCQKNTMELCASSTFFYDGNARKNIMVPNDTCFNIYLGLEWLFCGTTGVPENSPR